MQFLLPLASLLGIEAEELLDRLRRNAMAWLAVALFGVIGIVFLLVSLHTGLVAWLGPIWGPLAIAGMALLVASGIGLWIRIGEDIARRRERERRHSAEKTALVTTAAITALPMLMGSDLMKKVGIPVGGALAAAFLLTRPGGRKDDAGE